MTDELERRWDDAVETAWREFRQRLADHVAGMGPDDSLVVEMPQEHDGGASPYCQVAGGDDVARVEAVSNVYLADECLLDDDQEAALGDMGFQQPNAWSWEDGDTNFWLDVDRREADRVAVMVVRALREVYGVLHPIYLDAEGLEPAREGGKPLPPKPVRAEPDMHEVVRPTSVEEVRAFIDVAVAGLYDEAPEWDDEGDLLLPTEEQQVWILVHKTIPRVLISCLLVEDVADQEAALAEVNQLNRTEFGLTFFLVDGRISVTREVGLDVATPATFLMEVQRLLTQVDGWATDLEKKLSAVTKEPKRRDGRFEAAYAVMAELERDQRGSVGPATMARVYGNDTGLLLKAIRITEQRRREMRGKVREARNLKQHSREKVVQARHDYLRDLAARMRAALRLIVDAPVRKVQLDQLALFDEDEAGTGR
ncbi:YbjN domain-containing protein [Nocardioides okcheonensis]|uniref:YbjN domain-containing protein n=1 Tax=Nocardioides okcheonensis TaxID=2894081 RepID=UPI001E49D63B|nr:YbjN domain-containing protein [Nocardioides okcheonensis]UFN46437.1 YbjN domain-containing protein [Nocardioides okcheonensis]